MPTLAQVRNRVNNWLSDRWPLIQARQAAYFRRHGRYFQGLPTHSEPPQHSSAGDNDEIPDRLNGRPTDQAESWRDFLDELHDAPLPAAIRSDVYQGWRGFGYVITVQVRFDGDTYERAQHVGPEADRAFNWRQFVDSP